MTIKGGKNAENTNLLRQLEVVVDMMSEGVVVADAQRTVVLLNRVAEELLGLSKREAVGKPLSEVLMLIDEVGQPLASEAYKLATALHATEKITVKARLRHKSGAVFPAELHGQSFRDALDARYAVVTFRDITEDQTVDSAKHEFIALASHQLRTPLAAIKWFTDLLLSDDIGQLNPEQREYIQHIASSNLRLTTMVDTMLLVSNLEAGSVDNKPVTFDLTKEAHQTLQAELAISPKQAELTVKESYEPNLPRMQGDLSIIRTLLHHIIANAIKYTPKAGRLSLEITKSPLKNSAEGGAVAIIVSDNGYGIPKSAQDKVFSKFFRAKNIRDKDTDGTGLGLYIVKRLLAHIGGRISFSSTEGVGSTFIVELPCRPNK